jgi:hypothetical protein
VILCVFTISAVVSGNDFFGFFIEKNYFLNIYI